MPVLMLKSFFPPSAGVSGFLFFFFFFLAIPHGMRDLSAPTRDQTLAPCSGNAES